MTNTAGLNDAQLLAIVVQVVDGGRGGSLTVARSIALLPSRRHHLVLTGSHLDDRPAIPEGAALSFESVAKGRWPLVLHLVRLLRSFEGSRILVAHRDWLACRAAGILSRAPVIFVSHGRTSMAPRRWKRYAHSIVYHAQLFVAVSSDARAILRKTLGVDSLVIENGVAIPPFVPPPQGRPLRLLYLGRFESSQKRPDIPVLVTAALAERGVDVDTTMLGDGPLADELARLALDCGVDDRLAFPGWVDNPRPYLEASHAVLHCTRWEGNPLAILEAVAAGRPVVASRVPGTHFLVGVRGVRLVDAPEETQSAVECFTAAVLEIHHLEETGSGEDYFRSIHEFAQDRFSLDRMLAAWRDLLEAEASPRPLDEK